MRVARLIPLVALLGAFTAATPAAATSDATPGWKVSSRLQRSVVGHYVARAGTKLLVGGGTAAGAAVADVWAYVPESDFWRPVASMKQARSIASATTLSDGRLLVVGGVSSGGATGSAEIYDPVQDRWTTVTPTTARFDHAAVRLANGRVLIVGGRVSGAPSATAVVYDAVNDKWSTANPMAAARLNPTATLLPNGRALVTGGEGPGISIQATAEQYDPSTNQWSSAGTMSTPRTMHTATALADGRVLIVGGLTTLSAASKTAELYDPAGPSWASAGSMADARASQTATRLYNGDVLVASGEFPAGQWTGSEIYHAGQNTWENIGAVHQGTRSSAQAGLLSDGRVVLVGGTGSYMSDEDTIRWTPRTKQTFSTAVVDLGSQLLGGIGTPHGVTVTNTGDQPLLFSNPAMTGASAAEFKVDAGGCAVAAVVPGASCQFGLRFAPAAEGQRRASFTFRSNDVSGPVPMIDVKGVGVVPSPTASPTPTATAEPTPEPSTENPASVTPTATPSPAPAAPAAKPAAKTASIVFKNGYRIARSQRSRYCRGKITLELRRGSKRLATRTTALDRQCRFGTTFKVAWSRIGAAKTLVVIARFHGNRYLGATKNRFVVKVPA